MKKKIVTLTIAAALSMSLLSGCGKATVDAGNNSVADSGTNSGTEKIDEVESAKITPECVHQWKEATFAEPKTCSLCGETEGEPKQSYFEEHGAQVADGPVACTVDAALFDYFETDKQRITDIVWEQLDCYSEPASEEGYQIIHLELGTSHQFYYDVSYSKNVSYEYGSWVYDSKGNGTKDGSGRIVYTFKVPDGYDGLVFAALPKHKYTGQDTENMDERERYAFDDEFAKDTTFYRINKEGMVPEKQQ